MVYRVNWLNLILFIYLCSAVIYSALNGAQDALSLSSVLLVLSAWLFPPGYEIEVPHEKDSEQP